MRIRWRGGRGRRPWRVRASWRCTWTGTAIVVGVVIGVFGFFISFGRLWLEARQRRRSIYAVTSERALIITGGRFGRCVSLNLDALRNIDLSTKPDGSGTIVLASRALAPF